MDKKTASEILSLLTKMIEVMDEQQNLLQEAEQDLEELGNKYRECRKERDLLQAQVTPVKMANNKLTSQNRELMAMNRRLMEESRMTS
ncbi:MAG: hypothetical protein PUF78_06565 [Lachnospiraceae bacterium]|nr:hypothetical protein [Lachnospiraceae bacterium]